MAQQREVGIMTFQNPSMETIAKVVDHGNLADDLAPYGLHPVLVSKAHFVGDRTEWLRADMDGNGLWLTYEPTAPDALVAVESRVVIQHTYSIAPPLLNANELKAYGGSKARLSEHFAGFGIPTKLIDTVSQDYQAALDALDAMQGDDVVLKPDKGSAGQGVQVMSKAEAREFLQGLFADSKPKPYVLQPHEQVGRIPEGIRALDADNQMLIDDARERGFPGEVRLFAVKNGSEMTIVPVLRLARASINTSRDIYVDIALPDALASRLHPLANTIVNGIAEAAGGLQQVIAAVDISFGSERLWIMEVNVRSPELPVTRENRHSARQIFPAVARALAALAGI